MKYDKLNYDLTGTSFLNSRKRRSTVTDRPLSPVNIHFRSYGREFALRLTPAASAAHQFARSLIELRSDEPMRDLDTFVQFYDGFVADEPASSRATGAIIDGVFYGTLRTADGHKYFFESARKFNHTLGAHSIVYRESDLNLNKTRLGKFKRAIDARRQKQQQQQHQVSTDETEGELGCASAKKEVREWMQKEQEKMFNERVKDQVNRLINNIIC